MRADRQKKPHRFQANAIPSGRDLRQLSHYPVLSNVRLCSQQTLRLSEGRLNV
jgi:hypothetical protein